MRKILFIAPVCLLFFWSIAHASTDQVYINQVQVEGDAGANDEFIELFNPTDSPVSLNGWSLQYRSGVGTTYSKKNLPVDAVIGPNNYYLIGRNGYNGTVTADHMHSSFSLSGASAGAVIFLVSSTTTLISDSDSGIVDEFSYSDATVPPSENSLMRTGEIGPSNPRKSSYTPAVVEPVPSPEPPPVAEPVLPPPPASPTPTASAPIYSSAIIISEFLPNPDGKDDGEEWIKLYNTSETEVDISDWILDDAGDTIGKDAYIFPKNSIVKPKSYIMVKLSENNFALNNTTGDSVRLFWPDKKLASSVTYLDEAKIDDTYLWTENGYVWSKAQAKEVAVVEKKVIELPKIVISELFPEPRRGSSDEEYIELFNATDASVDLTGFELTDNVTSFKLNTELPAGQYLVVKKSESKISMNNTGSETLSLVHPSGEDVDFVTYEDAPTNQSYNLLLDGTYKWSTTLTPNFVNKITAPVVTPKAAVKNEEPEPVEMAEAEVILAEAETLEADQAIFASETIAGTDTMASIPVESEPIWPWLAGNFAVNLVFCYSLVKLMTRKESV